MLRIDTRFERALLAVAAVTLVALLAASNGEPILAGDTIAIAIAAGVAVYASRDDSCDSCGCC